MFFKKKIQASVEIKTIVCNHKWKDFGITSLTTHLSNGEYRLTVYKHYACIWCKEYKEVLLNTDWCKTKEILETKIVLVKEIHKIEYKSAIMERIADFQLIDKEYLEIARQLHPDRGI